METIGSVRHVLARKLPNVKIENIYVLGFALKNLLCLVSEVSLWKGVGILRCKEVSFLRTC